MKTENTDKLIELWEDFNYPYQIITEDLRDKPEINVLDDFLVWVTQTLQANKCLKFPQEIEE